jgi:hypothetical protein
VVIMIYLESIFNSASNAYKKTGGCESSFRDIRPGKLVVSVKSQNFEVFGTFPSTL